jgi:hypothetical protein
VWCVGVSTCGFHLGGRGANQLYRAEFKARPLILLLIYCYMGFVERVEEWELYGKYMGFVEK